MTWWNMLAFLRQKTLEWWTDLDALIVNKEQMDDYTEMTFLLKSLETT